MTKSQFSSILGSKLIMPKNKNQKVEDKDIEGILKEKVINGGL